MAILKFKEKFVVTDTTDNNGFSDKFLKWFRKYEKILAIIVANVLFILIISLAIYNSFPIPKATDPSPNSDKTNKDQKISGRKLPGRNTCTKSDYCDTCNNQDLTYVIEWINSNYKKFDFVKICLANVPFPNAVITNETFANVIPTITFFKIDNIDIKDITQNTLASHPFQLNTLILTNTNILKLQKYMLDGVWQLNEFGFNNDGGKRAFIEPGIFDQCNALTILQIQRYLNDADTVINIVGYKPSSMNNVELIDFRFNYQLNNLKANSFISTSTVQSIYLSDGGLETIDVQAFNGLYKLKLLTLNSNRITTLPNNIFQRLPTLQQLNLTLNPLICDCKLQWLQEFYINHPTIFNNSDLFCDSIPFETAVFCDSSSLPTTVMSTITTTTTHDLNTTNLPGSTTTTNHSLSTTTPKSTTKPADKTVVTVICNYSAKIAENVELEAFHNTNIQIYDKQVLFNFFINDDDPLILVIEADQDLSPFCFMWTNSYNEDDNGCVTGSSISDDENKTMKVRGLTHGSTYSFCLLHKEDVIYTPYDCMGVTIPLKYEERTWLKNKVMVPVISTVIVSIVVTIILSAFIAYFCIRKHPRLIKGNKNVIIIKEKIRHKNKDTSKEFDRPAYVAPSVITYDPGYLTPNYHKYSRVKYRPPLLRSISENSIYNDQDCYIQAPSPSRYQLESWRNNTRKRPKLENIYRNEENSDYDEIPPPIPGGHPHSYARKKPNGLHIPQHENLYSIV